MNQLKECSIALVLGVVFALLSVWITGVGAAIAVPSIVLKPIAQVSGFLALVLVDFFTVSIPVAVSFLMVALFGRSLVENPRRRFYLLLLAPLIFLQIYFFLLMPQEAVYVVSTMLPRYFLLILCIYLLTRSRLKSRA